MALEIEGKIVNKLGVQTGTSSRGSWSKQEFILEYQEGNFPTQVCMNVWGEDKVKDLEKFNIGDRVKASFNLSSREFNGRWYTDVRVWRMEKVGAAGFAQAYEELKHAVVPKQLAFPRLIMLQEQSLVEPDIWDHLFSSHFLKMTMRLQPEIIRHQQVPLWAEASHLKMTFRSDS